MNWFHGFTRKLRKLYYRYLSCFLFGHEENVHCRECNQRQEAKEKEQQEEDSKLFRKRNLELAYTFPGAPYRDFAYGYDDEDRNEKYIDSLRQYCEAVRNAFLMVEDEEQAQLWQEKLSWLSKSKFERQQILQERWENRMDSQLPTTPYFDNEDETGEDNE